jgi:hypothetical protein
MLFSLFELMRRNLKPVLFLVAVLIAREIKNDTLDENILLSRADQEVQARFLVRLLGALIGLFLVGDIALIIYTHL